MQNGDESNNGEIEFATILEQILYEAIDSKIIILIHCFCFNIHPVVD